MTGDATGDYLEMAPMRRRRDGFYARAREAAFEWINENGTPRPGHRVFQGSTPDWRYAHREPFRLAACLYTGGTRHVDLANAMVARYCDPDADSDAPEAQFGIFESNNAAVLLNRYQDLLSPEAEAVLSHHTRLVFDDRTGSAGENWEFKGANDNMPAMATTGLILGGEAMDDEEAVAAGARRLRQLMRLLARAGWMSEYNSGTYSGITLTSIAKIASFSADDEIRDLALQIEERLWAELLLHWHPGTLCQAGPASRAYTVDNANHMHNQHAVLWMAFGPDAIGRDLIATCFDHDGREIIHFDGYQPANIAEYVELLDTDLHVPRHLAPLIARRRYPATVLGMAEQIRTPLAGDGCGRVSTITYMEETLSLSSAEAGYAEGAQSDVLYATWRRRPEMTGFRDAGMLLVKFIANDEPVGATADTTRFHDGPVPAFGEKHVKSHANILALQYDNTAMLLTQAHYLPTQALRAIAEEDGISSLKLSLIVPAHYARIERALVGDAEARDFRHRSEKPVGVSLAGGEAFIHITPLVPPTWTRDYAVELAQENAYDVVHLPVYRGPARAFSGFELSRMLGGCVVTIRRSDDFGSLREFHAAMRNVRVIDYWSRLRRVVFQGNDLELEMVVSLQPTTVRTAAINGRAVRRPQLYSTEIEADALPFMSWCWPRAEPLPDWADIPAHGGAWGIGSRGVPGEEPYSSAKGRRPAGD